MIRALWSVLLVCGLVACSVTVRSRRTHWEPGFTRSHSYDGPPRLRQDAAELEQRLAAYTARVAARQSGMPEALRNPDLKDFKSLVLALDGSYRRGAFDHADALITRHQEQVRPARVMTFDDPAILEAALLKAEYRKQGVGGSLFVTVKRRPNYDGLLAISFPPGSYARPYIAPSDDELYGDWPPAQRGNGEGTPRAQDLVLLAARIAWLDPGVDEVELRFPVACGRFNRGEPRHGERFILLRFEKDAQIYQLAAELCALGGSLDHGAAQVAIWVLRDELSWADYSNKRRAVGPSMTFETAEVINNDDLRDAADLLLDAGLDPRATNFFEVPPGSRKPGS